MGTFYTVQFLNDGSQSTHDLDTEIEALLGEFGNQLSNWNENSWINQFNEARVGEPLLVPDHALEVIKRSLALAEKSEGILDPTIGPLIELWGFGTVSHQEVPSQEDIDQTLLRVGYQNLQFDPIGRTLEKTIPGLELNCSAIAKGYAVDLVAEMLHTNGIENYLINMGGEVRAHGLRLDGQPWKVGLRQPVFQGRESKTVRSIELHNQALATSGHAHRSFEINGKRYSHILNPRTGQPVPVSTASATVIAPTCALADGLATLALILDEAQMQELTKQFEDVEVFYTQWSTERLARRSSPTSPDTRHLNTLF